MIETANKNNSGRMDMNTKTIYCDDCGAPFGYDKIEGGWEYLLKSGKNKFFMSGMVRDNKDICRGCAEVKI
jgi:hypothetical protein